MLKKLDGMKMKQKLNFGYRVVILLMIVSGVFSIAGLSTLFLNLHGYINGSQSADTAVKVCRININEAARNIREMALNSDETTYEGYKQSVESCLTEVGNELQILKKTGLIEDDLYQEFAGALTEWGNTGYEIINEIEAGKLDTAKERIFAECIPALDNLEVIAQKIDLVTDDLKSDAIAQSYIVFIAGICLVVFFIVVAAILANMLGKHIIDSITTPLSEIEKVAMELTVGNLHSTLEYHSNDEIGSLAHSLRKSIKILGSYVDDISKTMQDFSKGKFIIARDADWQGDFKEILDAFVLFEKSMSDTVSGILTVSEQVNSGAEQVAASSMDLAEGATEQAGITEELAATITTVSEQVSQNADNASEISKKVENVGKEIADGNEKMQEMVQAMSEIHASSQQIGKIIASINEIAAQTNLLALNASIEAARAGDAGKGFAVVANQVSLLADQSAKAAKESAALIESSVSAVEKGSVIAGETAQKLENVLEGSVSITKAVEAVAEALDAQKESFKQIDGGVEHINDVVQTNSATSQECAAASQEMKSQAEELKGLIGKFEVRDFKEIS